MKLFGNVHLVGGGGMGLTHVTDGHIYLIDGGSELALVDAGSGIDPESLLTSIKDAGFDPGRISTIINTHSHWDHARGDAALQRQLGSTVTVHPNAVPILQQELWSSHRVGKTGFVAEPVQDVKTCQHGDTIIIGDTEIKVIETPGHTADSITLVTQSAGKTVAFTGDTLVGDGGLGAGTVTDKTDFRTYRESLTRILAEAPDAIMPGHKQFTLARGKVYVTFAIATIDASWHDMPGHRTPFYPSWWLTQYGKEVATV